ncbi:MAG: hypothetical protein U0559_05110 [Anaerolineae bacterium]
MLPQLAAPQFVSHLPLQTPALTVGTGVVVTVGTGGRYDDHHNHAAKDDAVTGFERQRASIVTGCGRGGEIFSRYIECGIRAVVTMFTLAGPPIWVPSAKTN